MIEIDSKNKHRTFLYYGGEPTHPFRGMKCKLRWQFESNPDFWMVTFIDLKQEEWERPVYEGVSIHNLKELK